VCLVSTNECCDIRQRVVDHAATVPQHGMAKLSWPELRLYRSTEEYHERCHSIREFIRFYRVPSELASRLVEVYTDTRCRNDGDEMLSVCSLYSNSTVDVSGRGSQWRHFSKSLGGLSCHYSKFWAVVKLSEYLFLVEIFRLICKIWS